MSGSHKNYSKINDNCYNCDKPKNCLPVTERLPHGDCNPKNIIDQYCYEDIIKTCPNGYYDKDGKCMTCQPGYIVATDGLDTNNVCVKNDNLPTNIKCDNEINLPLYKFRWIYPS